MLQRQERYQRKKDKEYLKLFSRKKFIKPQDNRKPFMCEPIAHPVIPELELPLGNINIRNRLICCMFILSGIQLLITNSPIVLAEAAVLPLANTNLNPFSALEKNESTHFISRKILRKAKVTSHSYKPLIETPEFRARDITHVNKDCRGKMHGVTPGKICQIDDKTYYLKEPEIEGDRLLLSKYNLKFAKNNIGVTVPKTRFFYANEVYYFASKEIDFIPARFLYSHFSKPAIHSFYGFIKYLFSSSTFDREKIVKHIGENGIAKLAVVMTFFDDLNDGNWGYNQNGLVVVDLDKSPQNYYDRGNRLFCDNSIILSIDNVKEMRNIYKNMQSKSPPKLHASVDMPRKQYLSLLSVFSRACTNVINQFHGMNSSKPSEEINQELINHIGKY